MFANEVGGPTDPRADARDFKDRCKAARVPPKRLHDLRHTAATMMLDSDLDLRTAGQVLGHSQVAQTARYSHVLADRKSVAAARIEASMFGHRKGSWCPPPSASIANCTRKLHHFGSWSGAEATFEGKSPGQTRARDRSRTDDLTLTRRLL